MKSWREAATLVLTAKRPTLASTPSSPTIPECAKPKVDVTTLSGAKEVVPVWERVFDYQLLMLKRNSRSKFMPNAFVFPGGVRDKADISKDWLDWFRTNGVHRDDLAEFVSERKNTDRPLLMRSDNFDQQIITDIAFRLTALRETFEESGVLLHSNTMRKQEVSLFHEFPDDDSLHLLRRKVHNDPSEFLKLCQSLNLVPDIWSLSEWNAWLTPTNIPEHGPRRFDTVFYLAHLDQIPTTAMCLQEMAGVEWTDPASILHKFYRKQLWLAPPQVYELSRLLNFKNQQQLIAFNTTRQQQGCLSLLPVRIECDDGFLSLLPGDSMYPVEPDYHGSSQAKWVPQFKGSLKEARRQSPNLHRLVIKDNYDCKIKINIEPKHGHLNPLDYHHFQDQ